MKVNPLSVERQPVVKRTLEFKGGGLEFSIECRNITEAAYIRNEEEATDLNYRHNTAENPEVILGPKDIPCESNQIYWMAAVSLSRAQIVEDASDRYSHLDWIRLMQNPDLATQAVSALNQLMTVGESVKADETLMPTS